MPGPSEANVQSLDALRDVRLALMAFSERTASALGALRSKIDRTVAWLEQDRPMYWREQERRAYDLVAGARIAYETCRLRTVGGRHAECIEEKVALRRAKERLEHCRHKIDVVRHWTIEASRQADEYRGRSGPLQRALDEEVPNVIAMLSRMIEAIEAYASVGVTMSGADSVSLGPIDGESESEATAPTTPAANPTPPDINAQSEH
jgi:hypothetical protein